MPIQRDPKDSTGQRGIKSHKTEKLGESRDSWRDTVRAMLDVWDSCKNLYNETIYKQQVINNVKKNVV